MNNKTFTQNLHSFGLKTQYFRSRGWKEKIVEEHSNKRESDRIS